MGPKCRCLPTLHQLAFRLIQCTRSAGLSVKCKNCTFYGSINLVAGSIDMGPFTSNASQGFVNRTEAIVDYIDHGFVEFRANGLGAHIELDNTIEATDELMKWTVPLPAIPITPLLVSVWVSVDEHLGQKLMKRTDTRNCIRWTPV